MPPIHTGRYRRPVSRLDRGFRQRQPAEPAVEDVEDEHPNEGIDSDVERRLALIRREKQRLGRDLSDTELDRLLR
jgi:hypothetical protein